MKTDLVTVYDRLIENCRGAGFAGFDPFDGLESRIFQATPLRHFRASRLAWQQMVKRSPVDLRPLLMVPKGVNSKGLALFALAAISRRRAGADETADDLIKRLLRDCGIEFGESLAFGYNFDWQSRAFFAPKGTPTIVPTAFAARAIYENGGTERYQHLLRLAQFVTTELNRSIETSDEVCFSYTPIDHTKIYNASLLAAEILAYAGGTDNSLLARKAVRFVLNGQWDDGSWLYGPGEIHGWVDNFHTAFVLDSLRRITEAGVDEPEVSGAIERGFEFWIKNFFLDDGTPKYFDKQTYPIDIHAAAAAIVTLSGFARTDERALPLARNVAAWTIVNMIGPDGKTFYQKRRFYTVKTPFIRWGQAWMAYALALLIEAESTE
jgi:hypothetical protein